jgi:acyl-CoA thioesterase-1
LVPFLLEGVVGGQNNLMQPDGIHPNLDAQSILLAQVWEKLEAILGK